MEMPSNLQVSRGEKAIFSGKPGVVPDWLLVSFILPLSQAEEVDSMSQDELFLKKFFSSKKTLTAIFS
jgi:hypothetical protein